MNQSQTFKSFLKYGATSVFFLALWHVCAQGAFLERSDYALVLHICHFFFLRRSFPFFSSFSYLELFSLRFFPQLFPSRALLSPSQKQKKKSTLLPLAMVLQRVRVVPAGAGGRCFQGRNESLATLVTSSSWFHARAANTPDSIRATLYLGFLPSASCETLHSAHDIQARQALVRAQYVPARVASGWYPREEPFVYSGLSDADFEAIQAAGHDLLDGARFPLLQI